MPGLLPTTDTGPNLNSKEELLKPGVWVGKLPSTGVVHRLTVGGGKIKIERGCYTSPHDGWTKHYDTLHQEDAEKHLHLLREVRSNPCAWQG
ncbi:hypothetical protein [Spirosoma sp. KUDC1026]|uniref:hypothetical protein n=1 Tax=Spirosoma sp. KUDC1026 TaxID=2745947 RepID=UPI00159B9844|nr:hypothetical protein [Spirosoma sp. KUDC1026]QKZ15157.1 hypothetical protein HU175_22050 [Spirosoma sp. KUDC1026]